MDWNHSTFTTFYIHKTHRLTSFKLVLLGLDRSVIAQWKYYSCQESVKSAGCSTSSIFSRNQWMIVANSFFFPLNFVENFQWIIACTFYLKGYYVPKSDGEFYQFCYVTHAGDIRGASTPFQFRSATPTEELLTVTEDDSNSDILVVTTKPGLLEVCHTRSRDLFVLRSWSLRTKSLI